MNVGAGAGRIRAAGSDDLVYLQEIQLAAGVLFRDIGMVKIAENPPLAMGALARYQQAQRMWVFADRGHHLVGFVVVDIVDGCAHVEQVSVHPDHGRQGIGRMLLDHVGSWSAGQGLCALTLMTFRAVPWNAPYYRRLGFREVAQDLTPGLADIIAAETASGLDPATRVCMRREIG